ncbi:Bifunctional folate synthesis protein [Phycisphaerales bacterium]|nr:Bifunctional folate synthesis protein [Phycisphaerales bacterium]
MHEDRIRIQDLLVKALIGLHEWERRGVQDVLLTVTLFTDLRRIGESDRIEHGVNYGTVARAIIGHVESSQRFTIESLATDVAGLCLAYAGVRRVNVQLCKPGAEKHARFVAVEIERTSEEMARTAYIVLGSNLRPEERLRAAFERVRELGDVLKATGVYQSPAGDVPGKPDFLNAAVALRTTLPAAEIRRRLKAIEKSMGRGEEQGAGIAIDLDLCLLDQQVIEAGDVCLPHKQVLERHHVPALLCELDSSLAHPVTGESLHTIAKRLGAGVRLTRRTDFAAFGVGGSA